MKMKAETVRGTQSKFVNATFTNIQKKGSNANSLQFHPLIAFLSLYLVLTYFHQEGKKTHLF